MPPTPPDQYPSLDQLRIPSLHAADSAWTCVGELPADTGDGTDAPLDDGHAATLGATPRCGPAVSYEYDDAPVRLHVHMAGAGPTQPTAEPTPDRWQLTIDGREYDAMGDVSTSTVERSVEAVQRLAVQTAETIHALTAALGPILGYATPSVECEGECDD